MDRMAFTGVARNSILEGPRLPFPPLFSAFGLFHFRSPLPFPSFSFPPLFLFLPCLRSKTPKIQLGDLGEVSAVSSLRPG